MKSVAAASAKKEVDTKKVRFSGSKSPGVNEAAAAAEDRRKMYLQRAAILAEIQHHQQAGDSKSICEKRAQVSHLTKVIYGPLSKEYTSSACDYGTAMLDDGKVEEAYDYLSSFETYMNFHNLPYYDIRATLYLGLGNVLFAKKEWDESLRMYLQSLNLLETRTGKDSPASTTLLLNIGLVYIKQDRYADAIMVLLKSLKLSENVFGGKSKLTTADVCHNLAVCFDRQSREAEALRYYERALKIRERELGPDHILSADTKFSMANILKDMKRLSEAAALHQECCRTRRNALGEFHPSTVESYFYMGSLSLSMGEHHQASVYLEKAVAGRSRLFGDTHALTLEARVLCDQAKMKAQRKRIGRTTQTDV